MPVRVSLATSPRVTAVLGSTRISADAQKAANPRYSSSLRPGPSPQRPAETYVDSEISGGTADSPRWRGCLGGVLYDDGQRSYFSGQPDQHLTPKPLERPAVTRGSIRLKAEGQSNEHKGVGGPATLPCSQKHSRHCICGLCLC